MKKRALLLAALVSITAASFTSAKAADVTTWSEFNTTEDIKVQNDISATGTPKVINTGASVNAQTIDGGYHSLVGSTGYQIKIGTRPELTIQNFGKIENGNEDSHTFSYTDANGDSVYKTITNSISGFNLAPIQPNSLALSKLTVKDVVYSSNTGKVLDIWLKEETDKALIQNTVFYNNNSTEILSLTEGTFELNNIIFDSNTAEEQCILIYSGLNTTIDNSIFQNNTTDYYGVIQSSGGELNISNSQFINNINNLADAGAISITGGGLKNVSNTIFKDNKAPKSLGGAIWLAMPDNTYKSYFSNVTFENNKAAAGGALTGWGEGNIFISDSTFKNNQVSGSSIWWGYEEMGGAIFLVESSSTIINTSFEGNKASAGGGIYAGNAAAVYIVDTDFSDNEAVEGGAIYSENTNLNIFANSKDVTFNGNTASNTTSTYNGGDAIYFEDSDDSTNVEFNLNAADGKKVIFNDSVAAYGTNVILNVNKSGLSYDDINGNSVDITNKGEIQFNGKVGDASNPFNINLYGGTLSIGKNSTATNPDGLINDNNFYVMGNSTLSTVNGVIGNFAPKAFSIASGKTLDYMFDVDLVGGVSDTLAITDLGGSLALSSFNVISDTDADGLKIKYSDTNVEGVVKDGYSITTSVNSYDVTAENDGTGSYVVFTKTSAGGGLANAIANESDQYIITSGEDENVTGWSGSDGNVIKSDIDINGNGNSIYTENGLDGMVVSDGVDVTLRNVDELSGFNNALTNDGGTLTIIDSNITGNTGDADITNNGGNVTINAETKDVTIGSDATDYALLSDGGTIDVTGSNSVTFNGDVAGDNDAQMNISTDTTFNGNVLGMNVDQSSGTVEINGELSEANYTLDDGTLNVNESGSFSPDNFELNNGTINIANELVFAPESNTFNGGNFNAANDNIGSLNFNDLTLNGTINLAVDVDLYTGIMDTISASTMQGNGKIKVNKFNLLSDTNKPTISIDFADENLRNFVSTDVKTVEGKIFKYNVGYDSKTGQFTFAGGGNKPDGYSPSIMASPVAAQLQGYFTQLNSYDEAFRNMDMYMLLPKKVRQAMKYRNRVAINSSDYVYDSDKTIYDNSTGWVRTHTTFEKVPLKNGPKVSNVAYGTYFGGESKLYDLGKGWEGMWGLYAGYNGSHQSYSGVSMYQNGGTLGLLGMVYKGNFFQGLTINTGANGGEASTRYGNEDFAMLMAGVASKTGYNIELKEGKFIVQPSLLLSYSFVNTFDYTNAAGIKISSDPLHAIQVEPNIKFIANLKNGWQPYASVGMVWNIMDKTHYMANDVSLPELSVKPYVKYGVGIRKSWGERFTGFFQTFITNGGRNGVGLQLGFRWSLGGRKSKTKVMQESTTVSNRKVIKKS